MFAHFVGRDMGLSNVIAFPGAFCGSSFDDDWQDDLAAAVNYSAAKRGRSRGKPRSHRKGVEAVVLHPTPSDSVVVLRPQEHRFPGKRYFRAPDGSIERQSYGGAVWFEPLHLFVGNLDSLHTAFCRVADAVDGRAGLVVRGDLIHDDGRQVTRCKKGKPGKPAGLQDACRRWLVLDIDKLPNMPGLDPREEPQAVEEFVRSLLPPALRGTRASRQWSSSQCVGLASKQVPETLSAHFRYWLDTPLNEAECRDLLKRLNAAVRARLTDLGVAVTGGAKIVDPKCADYNQPIFAVRPRFDDAIQDPFPGDRRYGITGGETDVVSVAELMAELPSTEDIVARQRVEMRAQRQASRAAKAAERYERHRLRVNAVADSAMVATNVVSLKVERSMKRVREMMLEALQDKIDQVKVAQRAGLLRDIVRLVHDRIERGLHDPEWHAWHVGIPEGQRDYLFFRVAALIARDAPNLRAYHLLAEMFAEELGISVWYQNEFCSDDYQKGKDSAIVERLLWHQMGAASGGGDRDIRYEYAKDTLIADFEVTEEEMERLGLEKLISDAIRKRRLRWAKGGKSMDEYLADRRIGSLAETKPWEALGISERTYYRRKAAGTLPEQQREAALATVAVGSSGICRERGGWSPRVVGAHPQPVARALVIMPYPEEICDPRRKPEKLTVEQWVFDGVPFGGPNHIAVPPGMMLSETFDPADPQTWWVPRPMYVVPPGKRLANCAWCIPPSEAEQWWVPVDEAEAA